MRAKSSTIFILSGQKTKKAQVIGLIHNFSSYTEAENTEKLVLIHVSPAADDSSSSKIINFLLTHSQMSRAM